MRGGGRHCRRQNKTNLRQSLQQTSILSPALGHARTDSMGHRPIPHLQGRPRALLGSSGQRQRLPASLGHLRRPREGPPIRVRSLGRRPAMLQHKQSRIFAKLPSHVVPGNPKILSEHSGTPRRVQKRLAVHVPRRSLLELLPRSQPLRARHAEERSRDAGRSARRSQRVRPLLLRNVRSYVLWS